MTINATLRRQHGVISRRQARKAGLTDHQIDRRLSSGDWVVVHRGVFRHAAARVTWRSRVAAAVLATGGVASGLCAAALWGLEIVSRPRVEVTIPDTRRSRIGDSVTVHHTSQWDDIDRTMVHGIATTGVERTILDCAAVLDDDALERLAESAIRQRLTTWSKLAETLEGQGRPGRDGTAGLRRLLDRRLGDPVVPRSDFSRRVQHLLRDAGLPEPQLEYRIVDEDGRHLLLADLAWPERMCVLELDGMADHFGRTDRERDIRKRAEVRAAGWRLLEIGWELYAGDPSKVVDLVRRFLAGSEPFCPLAGQI